MEMRRFVLMAVITEGSSFIERCGRSRSIGEEIEYLRAIRLGVPFEKQLSGISAELTF